MPRGGGGRSRSNKPPPKSRRIQVTGKKVKQTNNQITIKILAVKEVDDLPAEITRPCGGLTDPGSSLRERVRSATRRIEREAIVEALTTTQGNVTRAAEQLGLSRRGLQLKMKELAIDRD